MRQMSEIEMGVSRVAKCAGVRETSGGVPTVGALRKLVLVVEPDSPLSQAAAALGAASGCAELRGAAAAGTFGARELRLLRPLLSQESASPPAPRHALLAALVRASAPRLARAGDETAAAAVAATAAAQVPNDREHWRAAMRGRQLHRDYAGLVSDVVRGESQRADATGFRLFSQQLSIGMSLLVTLISAVLLGFFAGRAIFGADRPAAALGLAAACGIALFVAEALLTVIRLARVDAKQAAEARRRGGLGVQFGRSDLGG